MVVAIYRDTVDVGIENDIVLGEMAVAAENCSLVENGIEDSAVLYSCFSSNIQLSPLLVLIFYITTLRWTKRL